MLPDEANKENLAVEKKDPISVFILGVGYMF